MPNDGSVAAKRSRKPLWILLGLIVGLPPLWVAFCLLVEPSALPLVITGVKYESGGSSVEYEQ